MPVETKDHVFDVLRQHHHELRDFGVKRYGLFGSFIRAEQRITSDIDILVEFEPQQKTFDKYIHLLFFLEDTLGRKVDLVTPESLSPYIGPSILSEVEYVTTSA